MSVTPRLEREVGSPLDESNFLHYKIPEGCGPIRYTWRQDRLYRAILLLIPAGLCLAAAGFFWNIAVLPWGVGLWDAGVLGSALTILIWDRKVKRIIVTSAVVGIVVQLLALFLPLSGFLLPLGAGITAIGAAGISGKEAHCFAIREGWWLIPVYAFTALTFLFQLFAAGRLLLAVTAILATSFTVRKLLLPLIVVDEE